MMVRRRAFLTSLLSSSLAAIGAATGTRWSPRLLAAGQPASAGVTREVVLLYTNDFHSALDPIAAYWLPKQPRLGGAAALAGYINRFRAANDTTFLFDAGDMFTGLVSHVTRGEALVEMMRAMRYDAMAIGHHEFDYGAATFERQMLRVPMPVLGANIFYKGTKHRYSRPYVILERNDVRVGVIGVIGPDVGSAVSPDGIADLEFEDPATAIAPLVTLLRPQVDLLVVLAHQGKTGPQQTDAETHAGLQRDFDADIRLAADVPGIDVIVGGHAHRGIERPHVVPETGTIIVQTYGYGTRLGVLRLQLRDGRIASHAGELVTTWTARVSPDPAVARVVDRYTHAVAESAGPPIVTLGKRVFRAYHAESPLGNAVADAMRQATGAEIAFQNAGGLRADLPDEPITQGHVIDVLPFVHTVDTYRLSGAQVLEVLEQSLTLERGLMQVSGLVLQYDLARPGGSRVVSVRVGTEMLDRARTYTVATNSFVGQGGDLYATFAKAEKTATGKPVTEVFTEYLGRAGAPGVEPASPFVATRQQPRQP